MEKLNVYLVPGFGGSDLGVLSNGDKLWWDFSIAAARGLGGMRLAADGTSPGAPDGVPIGVDPAGQFPWGQIGTLLRSQLDSEKWSVAIAAFDWRKDLLVTAETLASSIRSHSSSAYPATIVGHSAGGLVAVAAYASLVSTGHGDYVRRIVSICTPFQGSYAPVLWLNGTSGSVRQLADLANMVTWIPVIRPLEWSADFLNALALTWPSFYQLFPFLGGTEAVSDPYRGELFNATNYPAFIRPDQTWLTQAKDEFQAVFRGPNTFPPPWVMTCVVSSGIPTAFALSSARVPLVLSQLSLTSEGDGVVTRGSQLRQPSLVVDISSDHSSAPLGLTNSGVLADLIRDPRAAPSPAPPAMSVQPPITQNATEPPNAEEVSGLVCVGGG